MMTVVQTVVFLIVTLCSLIKLNPEDEASMFIQNAGIRQQDYIQSVPAQKNTICIE
jgi:hypothetical protein